ncbi:LLM class flavin-dependent oxidoreductase [Microbacterium sp. MPKO10]|uniref:LLM class flavin-dependent oxidoreductase n=1 Tax=Microbacterium sp. MPKO10 TaxID=2989818 RepID=UPI00223640DA|nr:LLM class flavin-dependent oxidoreductase [Microbacterium sp. MPKO10]MCW4458729.1 LLM class flavin-dependent oxidoreductase [Microbacterium sp. MPKO10]
MRYESPLYFAEQAASLDLIAGGRVHLGIGRGSPEAADRGYQHFGHAPAPGKEAGEMAREHTRQALAAVRGVGIAAPNPEQSITRDLLPVSPQSPTVHERISWGAGNRDTAVWAAENGMGLMSSTVIIDDAVTSFSALQAEQIDAFTNAWRSYGWPWRPRITVIRSIVPIVDDESRFYFGTGPEDRDGAGILDGTAFRYGGSYIGSPEDLVNRLRDDVALAAADTVLVTIPSQLGVDFNTRQLAAVHAIGRELGWNDEKTGQETP